MQFLMSFLLIIIVVGDYFLIHVVFFRSSVGIQVHCVSDLLFRIQVQCVSDLLSRIQVSCASWTQDGAECFFQRMKLSKCNIHLRL